MGVGLCVLGLLAPAVSRADNCTDEQPFKGTVTVEDLSLDLKGTCKGVWTVFFTLTVGAEDVTTDFAAFEDTTGKECSGKMFTPTGGTDEYDTQQATCKFTKDQQVKISVKRK
jgi:hypothetical protein